MGLGKAGYTRTPALAYYEKVEPVGPDDADLLEALGGRLLPVGAWEEIAPVRGRTPTSEVHGVTNELLELIPTLRQRDTRLLVAATNSIRSTDSAFLRPGRFDHLLPVGPPDDVARQALWGRFVAASDRQDVDVGALAAATGGFTPADIEYAARVAAQTAFEREVVQGQETDERGASTDDYLAAVAQVTPTVTAAVRCPDIHAALLSL